MRRVDVTTRERQSAIAAGFDAGMYQIPDEIEPFTAWLMQTLGGRLGGVIDIGAHQGGTCVLWGALGATQIVSVDLPFGPWGGLSTEQCDIRNAGLTDTYPDVFSAVLGDSQDPDIADLVAQRLRAPVDLLFIDGDHSARGVQADMARYRPLVRPGGVIAFHDIKATKFHRDRGVMVSRFWDTVPDPKWTFLSANPAHQWGGIGAVIA
jgi:cephalosporin hydroxylase